MTFLTHFLCFAGGGCFGFAILCMFVVAGRNDERTAALQSHGQEEGL